MAGRFIERDVAAIFRQTAFAETITLNGSIITEAIFDNADREVAQGEGVTNIVPIPMVQVPTRTAEDIFDGAIAVIRSRQYRVVNWKHDGTGVTEIYLEGPLR